MSDTSKPAGLTSPAAMPCGMCGEPCGLHAHTFGYLICRTCAQARPGGCACEMCSPAKLPDTDPAPPPSGQCAHVLKRMSDADAYICERCSTQVPGLHVAKLKAGLTAPLASRNGPGRVDEIEMRTSRARMLHRSGLISDDRLGEVLELFRAKLAQTVPPKVGILETSESLHNLECFRDDLLFGLMKRLTDPGDALMLLAMTTARIIHDQAIEQSATRGQFIEAMDRFLNPAPPSGGYTGTEN